MERHYLHLPAGCLLILTVFSLVSARDRRHCPGLDSFLIAECGRLSIPECSQQHSEYSLAHRLDKFLRWIDTIRSNDDNLSCSSRVAALKERYADFRDTNRLRVDTAGVVFVGGARAPVALVLYISASCPLCKRVYRGLYNEVTDGKLRRVSKLGIKVFSERSIDIALLAAGRFNRQCDLLLSLEDVKERISIPIIFRKAHEIGLPDSSFRALLQDSVLMKKARASVLEGEKIGVSVTPTVFINGRRYRGYKDPQWIVDAALYEYELLGNAQPGSH
jgi:protein-disulfide isomerase